MVSSLSFDDAQACRWKHHGIEGLFKSRRQQVFMSGGLRPGSSHSLSPAQLHMLASQQQLVANSPGGAAASGTATLAEQQQQQQQQQSR